MEYERKTISVMILPVGEPIFSEQAIEVRITDEAGGEFIEIRGNSDSVVGIDPEQWPTLRAAIDYMVKECRG
jgi:hypothetical protein